MPGFPDSWNAVADGDDRAARVGEHLRFLARSDKDEKILDDMMRNFVTARLDQDSLNLVFRYTA